MLAAMAVAAAMLSAWAAEIDPVASRIGFTLKTRWGQTLQGRFPDAQGDVAERDDGRHQVRLRLSSGTVEILGHPSYTRVTRGSGFFDAADYPHVDFLSDPYPPDLLRHGGEMPGVLTIHGVSRREAFTIQPAHCERPARDCDVVASGSIRRTDYGINRWNFALSDNVHFSLRVRVRAGWRGPR